MSKFIPILFSTPMVQAILEGRKTMTRRVIKSNHESGIVRVSKNNQGDIAEICSLDYDERYYKDIKCPYGSKGDILWVRETFYAYGSWAIDALGTKFEDYTLSFADYYYMDNIPTTANIKTKRSRMTGWYKRPSLFMPKAACRIFLQITNIKVERLMDISEEDAKREGVLLHERGVHWLDYQKQAWKVTQFVYCLLTAKDSFRSLWNLINGNDNRAFSENPFVWVVEFKRVEKPEGFINS